MKYFKNDTHLLFGLVLIGISTALFMIEPNTPGETSNLFTFLFFLHFSLPLVYCLVLYKSIPTGFFSLFGSKIYSEHIILLILYNISAYSLNREIAIFYESTNWLTVLIVLESILFLALAFFKTTPKWLCALFIVATPILLLFHIHQLLIVLPMSLFGLVGGLFLGIGLLLFIPAFYVVAIVRTLINLNFSLKDLNLLAPGFLAIVVVIGSYALRWNNIDEQIQNGYLDTDVPFGKSDLPEWIAVSKSIKDDFLTEAYLKSELVYQQYDRFLFTPRFGRFDEKKVHDPIIAMCMFWTGKQSMDQKSRIQILNFLYEKRHQTADRFWSGDNLTTDQVVTNVQVFPLQRLTYSEMLLTIANNDRRNRWRPQEEAIYTFQLPEGGVITSLSLWIEGVEEKGILTTKSKAQTAYNTIVGREMRDPSVIYWMEGNQARIRVFPCTPAEKRKFKVGVTAPLKINGQLLEYQSITFKGPDYSDARSSINVVTNGARINSDFDFISENDFISWRGNYTPDWSFSIDKQPITEKSFKFLNEVFISQETNKKFRQFNPKYIYLDITNNWTEKELSQIEKLFANGELITLEGPNKLIESSAYPNFTLFPYHKISAPENSIVITKGGLNTPNLEDLKNADFRQKLFDYFNKSTHPVLVLDIGEYPTDYNQSLKEFGVLSYHKISMEDLDEFVTSQKYPDPTPKPGTIDLVGSGISVKKVDSSDLPQGSDHLMRLFYYQSIMNQIGNSYFNADDESYIEEKLTESAAVANVVTPLSSLIVLETQEDYDRFDIKENKDSLGNASINNNGAVPEPHEWALIISGLGLLVFIYFKKGISLF